MSNFKRIVSFIKPYKNLAILNAVGNILSVIFSLFTFFIIGKVMGILFKVEESAIKPLTADSNFKDRMLYDVEKFAQDLLATTSQTDALLYVSLALVVSFLFKNIFRYMAQYYLAPLRSNVIQDIRSAVHKKILKLPISYFSEKRKGDIITRLQDFENSKHYVKSNYEKSTYKLYVKKIDRYNDVLESDVAKGFTFSKVYVFNSKRSKYVLSNEIENIEFIDPSTDETKFLNKDVPHIFAQIKDLKLSGSSNPLNFSSQRVIEILDHRLQKNKDVDLKQDFFYHSNTKDNKACSCS